MCFTVILLAFKTQKIRALLETANNFFFMEKPLDGVSALNDEINSIMVLSLFSSFLKILIVWRETSCSNVMYKLQPMVIEFFSTLEKRMKYFISSV